MAGPIRISILADARNAMSAFQNTAQAAQNTQSRLAAVGGFMKGALASAAVAGGAAVAAGLAVGFKKAVDSAAELQANIGATKQIFGAAAGEVLKFGDKAATSLGVSKAEALGAAKQFGAFYTAIGFTNKQAAQMSVKFTDAAGNLAAFGDSTPTEALEAMTSALRGEYDPLQKYIPTVNAAAVEQKAMAMSGKKNAKSLTDQEKALALQSLVYESVANKAGKAERAQGGYTQQMSKLKAQLTDIGAKIGSAFLPALTKAAGWVNDTVIPAFKNLSEKYGPAVKSFFSTVGSVLSGLKMPDLSFNMDASGASGMIGAFKGYFTTMMPIIKQIGSTIASTFQELLPKIKPIFSSIASTVKSAFTIVTQVVKAVTATIMFLWTHFGTYILDFIRGALSAVVDIVSGVFQVLKGIFQTVAAVLTGDWKGAWDGIKTIVAGAKAILIGIFNALAAAARLLGSVAKTVLVAAWNAIKDATSSIWNSIKAALSSVWTSIKTSVSSAVSSVRTAVSNAWSSIKTATSNAWSSVKTAVVNAWTSVKTAVSNGVSNAVSTVRELPGRIKGALSGAGSWLTDAGRRIIQGLIDGISNMVGSLRSKLSSITSLIPDWKGPARRDARLLYRSGQLIMGGLVAGIDDKTSALKRTLSSVTGLIHDGVNTNLGNVSLSAGTLRANTSSGNVYTLNVNVPPSAEPSEVGREIIKHIQRYEKTYGRSYLNSAVIP